MPSAIGRMPKKRRRRVFLWACCEGWFRMGPYAWVGLSEDREAFVDEKGKAVLIWNDRQKVWRTADPSLFSGDLIRPMVNSSPVHPKPMSGAFPILDED